MQRGAMKGWSIGVVRLGRVHGSGSALLQPSGSSNPISWRYSSDKTILIWQWRLRMGPADPRALGVKRRKVEAVCATASWMHKRSVLRLLYSFLCSLRSSALAMAESSVLATKRALLRGTTARTALARWAGSP